jgi:hypothetical protein
MDREWTDKRMDDFAGRVDRFEANGERRFDKVDARFDRFEADVDARFDKTATKEQLEKIDARLDRWGKILSGGVVAIAGAVIAKVIGV